MPRLGTTDGKRAWFALPPLAEQYRIVSVARKAIALAGELDEHKSSLLNAVSDAKSKILALAISGKLVPQDPHDEPASVLLERLQAEREQLVKDGKIKRPKATRTAHATVDNSHYEKLPSGWAVTTLGNIGHWQSGATPSRRNPYYYNGEIPWLKTGELNDGLIDYIPEKITELALEQTSVKLNPVGSVLIAMYGATIGKLGILGLAATTNQACCACVKFFGILPKYLFYLLLERRQEFIQSGIGGAQPNISKEIIVATSIALPPLAEQRRITDAIDSAFTMLDEITGYLK